MKNMKKVLIWCFLLSKRLYKKITFMILLLMIPVVVIAYSAVVDQEDSGMMTIVLVQEDPQDALSSQVLDALREGTELIRFVDAGSAQEAEDLVRYGKADSAWILPADLESHIRAFVEDQKENDGFIRVIVREDSVTHMIAREKLSGQMFDLCARYDFLMRMQMNVPELEDADEEEILSHYDSASIEDNLFSFSHLESQSGNSATSDPGYLKAPIRGLLGVVIVLCGLATAMYYIHDQQSGLFAWLPERKLPLVELGYQMVSLINVGIVALLSLAAVGLNAGWGRELLILVLYGVCCASFCQMLRLWCGSIRMVGTLLPLLTVVMIAICPVFYDLGKLRQLQYLFPPTYYINAAFNDKFIWYMLLHTLATSCLYYLGKLVLKRS